MSGLVRFFYISSFLIISHHFSHHALFKKQVFPGEHVVVHSVEELRQVYAHYISKALLYIFPRLEHSLLRALAFPETVSVLRESGGEYEMRRLMKGLLD